MTPLGESRSGCVFCVDAPELEFDYCRVCGRGLPEPPLEPPTRPFFDGRGCGHPRDPVAKKGPDGWFCHCGTLLDPALGRDFEEAPGPVVQCDGCGCHIDPAAKSLREWIDACAREAKASAAD